MESEIDLKNRIKNYCYDAGADIIGFAPVERWDQFNEVPVDFRPKGLWEPAKTVIVLGVSMPLPIVETTPSILHKESYDTANKVLDTLGFNLVRYLNRLGNPAYFFCRDGFGSLRILKDRPNVTFNHIMAAKYAGLGTVGVSNCLLTPEFGSRVRFVSVFTSTDLEGDPLLEKEQCIKCGTCAKCCPVNAITMTEEKYKGDFDQPACLERHIELTRDKAYPCGICTKVCPVGKDRLLYKQKGILKKYIEEEQALTDNPNDPRYKTWTVVRRYGSWNQDNPR